MKRSLWLIALGLCVVAAGWAGYQFATSRLGGDSGGGANEAGSQASAPESVVVALGRIEPAGKIIDVGGVVGDRLVDLVVDEGAQVDEGQKLAELESRRLRELERDAAQKQLAEAQARRAAEGALAAARITTAKLKVEQAEAQRLDMSAQEKKIAALKSSHALAVKDLERLEGLPEDVVSSQELERQQLLVEQAAAEVAAAEAALTQAQNTADLAVKAAGAELKAARASKGQVLAAIPVESLKVQCDLSEAQLKRTTVTAPCAGTVLKVFTRRGEQIGAAPILQMADLGRMVVVAEVSETDVKRIRPGQSAHVQSPAFPAPFDSEGLRGEVQRVGRLVGAAGLQPLSPLAPESRHVVEVRIELDGKGSQQAARFVNMEVDVKIDVDQPPAATAK